MKKSQLLSLVAATALVFSVTALAQQNNSSAPASAQVPDAARAPQFTITEVKVGDGAEAVDGKAVSVQYTGWLYDTAAKNLHGKKFDSSFDRYKAFTFMLGAHQVIPGWEQGLRGMKVGGKRTLIIPAELAYGARGAGGVIPPNAVLVFDVELVAVN